MSHSLVFNYHEFTSRNIGFIHADQQEQIRKAKIFIPGVGGMGGAALEALVRMGVENLIITDFDTFEISNLNRQIAATLQTMGQSKTEAAKQRALSINPNCQIEIISDQWIQDLDQILTRIDFVINGCDDIKATVALMRKAKAHKKTVIDAYASTFPSVYVVKPDNPRPEEFLKYPTVGVEIQNLTEQHINQCKLMEAEFVLTHTSLAKNLKWEYAIELLEGKRKRFSLAPMVITTGMLMSYEALKLILGEPTIGHLGIFLNPHSFKIEKPKCSAYRMFKRWMIHQKLKNL